MVYRLETVCGRPEMAMRLKAVQGYVKTPPVLRWSHHLEMDRPSRDGWCSEMVSRLEMACGHPEMVPRPEMEWGRAKTPPVLRWSGHLDMERPFQNGWRSEMVSRLEMVCGNHPRVNGYMRLAYDAITKPWRRMQRSHAPAALHWQ